MNSKQMVDLVTDIDFHQKVVIPAVLRQAVAIYAENPATTGHAARAVLANRVVFGHEHYSKIFALLIGVDDAFLSLTVPQGNALLVATAETRIGLMWNLVAGV